MLKASDFSAANKGEISQDVASLLGGELVFSHQPCTRLELHELLLAGLPAGVLKHIVDGVELLRQSAAMEKAIGISIRTFQRYKDVPTKHLNLEQSGRVWAFAEILLRAAHVLGSRHDAEGWSLQRATALEQGRPLDLMATSAGRRMVEELLERMEYGIYI